MGNQLQAEWTFVTSAPLLSVALILVVVTIVWAVVHFLYRHRIEGLKEEVDRLRAEASRCRDEADNPRPAAAPIPAPRPAREVGATGDDGPVISRSTRDNALIEVDRAKAAARSALQLTQRDPTAASGAIATMESALLTAKKVYGIRTPKASGNAKFDLQNWLRFFDAVWPLIKNGHIEEGRDKAAQISNDSDARLS